MDQWIRCMTILWLLLNSDASTSTSCRRAEYRIEKECCPMCSPGTRVHKHCTEYRSTSCIPCTVGTYLDEPNGQIKCFSCTSCHADTGLKVKRPCTPTADTVCEPLEEYYCIDLKQDGCIAAQKHSSCKPGQHISQKGTESTDTRCADCTGDTYSDGTFASCRPHTICNSSLGLHQIHPGSPSTDTECGPLKDKKGIIIGCVTAGLLALVLGVLLIKCMILPKKKRHKGIGDENVSGHEYLPVSVPPEPRLTIQDSNGDGVSVCVETPDYNGQHAQGKAPI